MIWHAEKLSPDAEHYILRFFSEPAGPIDEATGEPWKAYKCVCVLSVAKDGSAELKAAITAPLSAMKLARTAIAEALKIRELYAWRWNHLTQTKRRVVFPITHVRNQEEDKGPII